MSVNKYDKVNKTLIPIAKNTMQTSPQAIDEAVARAAQNKQDKIQFAVMPTANAENLGKVYQYIGDTTATYTSGVFYKCVYDGSTYEWSETSTGEIEKITSSQASDMWNGTYTHTTDAYLADEQANAIIGEVKSRLDDKADTADLGTAAAKNFATTIAEDGADLPTSGAVYTQIQSRIAVSEKGVASGIAELDANGLVPTSQLPSYVDDVLEGTAQNVVETGAGTYSATGFILTGETEGTTLESGKTYVDVLSNIQYRWTGTGNNLVSMGTNLTLGVLENTAYRGDRGKIAYDDSQANKASIGTMANLNTTEKGSLVGAVNELNSGKVNGEGMTLSVNADGTLRVTYDDGQ